MKKVSVKKVQQDVEKNIAKARAMAEKEIVRMRKVADASLRKAEQFVQKNPEKATLIAAGIGAALGATLTKLMTSKKRK